MLGLGRGISACFHIGWKPFYSCIKPVLGGALFLIVLPPLGHCRSRSLLDLPEILWRCSSRASLTGDAGEIQMMAVQEIDDAQKFR